MAYVRVPSGFITCTSTVKTVRPISYTCCSCGTKQFHMQELSASGESTYFFLSSKESKQRKQEAAQEAAASALKALDQELFHAINESHDYAQVHFRVTCPACGVEQPWSGAPKRLRGRWKDKLKDAQFEAPVYYNTENADDLAKNVREEEGLVTGDKNLVDLSSSALAKEAVNQNEAEVHSSLNSTQSSRVKSGDASRRPVVPLIMVVLALLGIIAIFASIDGGEDTPTNDAISIAENPYIDSFAGVWKLDSITMDGEMTELSSASERGTAQFLVLNEDGSCHMRSFGSWLEEYEGEIAGVWEPEDSKTCEVSLDGFETDTWMLKDDVLAYDQDGMSVSFAKIDSESLNEYEGRIRQLGTIVIDDEHALMKVTSLFYGADDTAYVYFDITNRTDEKLYLVGEEDSALIDSQKAKILCASTIEANEEVRSDWMSFSGIPVGDIETVSLSATLFLAPDVDHIWEYELLI